MVILRIFCLWFSVAIMIIGLAIAIFHNKVITIEGRLLMIGVALFISGLLNFVGDILWGKK